MENHSDHLLAQLAALFETLEDARQRCHGLRLLEEVHGQGHPQVADLVVSIREMERRAHALRRAVSWSLAAQPCSDERENGGNTMLLPEMLDDPSDVTGLLVSAE